MATVGMMTELDAVMGSPEVPRHLLQARPQLLLTGGHILNLPSQYMAPEQWAGVETQMYNALAPSR